MDTITIGNKIIGDGYPTFIVAEISCNHKQDIEIAKELIKYASKAGADAVKLQTFTPDTMTIDSNKEWFLIKNPDNPDSWQKKTLYDIYKEAYTPWEWHKELKDLAESLGLVFFSTPFDSTAVDFLEKINVPCYKVASYECTDIPLLQKIASTKKPVIMSVGFATIDEIEYSIDTLRKNGCNDVAILHCLTSYKSKENVKQSNIKTIKDIKRRFNVVAGLSDNMGGIDLPVFASINGANIIEKHLVLKHKTGTLDDRFSLDPVEFKKMVLWIRERHIEKDVQWQNDVLGKVRYGCHTKSERENRHYRRSLFAVKNIKKGDKFTKKNMKCIRPAYGLAPKYYFNILGKKATKDIEYGTPLSWDMV